jgi:hypothetical protein
MWYNWNMNNKKTIIRLLLTLLGLFTVGCYDAPLGTRHMNAEEIEMADFVADYFDIPEACRDYSNVGIYQAVDQEDFYQATILTVGGSGHCASDAPGVCPNPSTVPLRALTINTTNPPWKPIVILDTYQPPGGPTEGVLTPTFAHEMLHVFRFCQDPMHHGHGPQFPEIEEVIWSRARNGEVPFHMTFERPGYE